MCIYLYTLNGDSVVTIYVVTIHYTAAVNGMSILHFSGAAVCHQLSILCLSLFVYEYMYIHVHACIVLTDHI